MIKLREYQQKGVQEIRDAFASGKKSVLFVSPTGSGKTVTFSFIADQSQQKGKRATIMVHRAELIRQICSALLSFDVGYGLIQATKPSQLGKLTQVASVQTLVNRLDDNHIPDLLIIDECAHSTASTYSKILGKYEGVLRLGVTACPERMDGRGLGDIFDVMIMGPSVQELIDQGFLCRPIYYCPPSGISLEGIHTVGGDYNKSELEAAVDLPKITGSAVEHYTKLTPGKPAIAFCTSIKHAEHVRDTFKSAGYRSELIEGKMDERTRMERVRGLGNGQIQVLTSVDLISEGFDCPIVHTAILLRPTQSLSLALQQYGRVLRPYPGKRNAVILDHVGNVLRHGTAEQPREYTLEQTTRRKRKSQSTSIPIRQCPSCYAVFSPSPKCPQCGFLIPIQSRMVDEVSGTLVELSAADIQANNLKADQREQKELAHLKTIARQRGYNPKWAQYIIDARRKKRAEGIQPAAIDETGTIKEWKGETKIA